MRPFGSCLRLAVSLRTATKMAEGIRVANVLCSGNV